MSEALNPKPGEAELQSSGYHVFESKGYVDFSDRTLQSDQSSTNPNTKQVLLRVQAEKLPTLPEIGIHFSKDFSGQPTVNHNAGSTIFQDLQTAAKQVLLVRPFARQAALRVKPKS